MLSQQKMATLVVKRKCVVLFLLSLLHIAKMYSLILSNILIYHNTFNPVSVI